MEKAIIIGTYEFLGFHFCKRILEEGIEVIGIHLDFDDEKLLIEEKRLEIGRNANFREKKLMELHSEELQKEEVVLYIDFYDIFMRELDHQFFEKKIVTNVLSHVQREKCKIVFLLPITVLSHGKFVQTERRLHECKQEIFKKGIEMQDFYLPTIFGPWQSDVFLFQKMLISNKTTNISTREWTGDALYIDDVVNEILGLERDNQKEYMLSSHEEKRWEKCAELINIPYNQVSTPAINFMGVEKKTKHITPIKDGLENQKRLIKSLRLYD